MKEAKEFEELKKLLIDTHEAIYKLEEDLRKSREAYMQLEAKFCQTNSFEYHNHVLPKIKKLRETMEPQYNLPEDNF